MMNQNSLKLRWEQFNKCQYRKRVYTRNNVKSINITLKYQVISKLNLPINIWVYISMSRSPGTRFSVLLYLEKSGETINNMATKQSSILPMIAHNILLWLSFKPLPINHAQFTFWGLSPSGISCWVDKRKATGISLTFLPLLKPYRIWFSGSFKTSSCISGWLCYKREQMGISLTLSSCSWSVGKSIMKFVNQVCKIFHINMTSRHNITSVK